MACGIALMWRAARSMVCLTYRGDFYSRLVLRLVVWTDSIGILLMEGGRTLEAGRSYWNERNDEMKTKRDDIKLS